MSETDMFDFFKQYFSTRVVLLFLLFYVLKKLNYTYKGGVSFTFTDHLILSSIRL